MTGRWERPGGPYWLPAHGGRSRPVSRWAWFGTPGTIGLTAGASAPEVLVREVVDALRQRFVVTEEEAAHVNEGMIFKLPRELVD